MFSMFLSTRNKRKNWLNNKIRNFSLRVYFLQTPRLPFKEKFGIQDEVTHYLKKGEIK